MALLTLFEILEVSSRADLKSDLLQELERQKQVLLSFRNNPDISEDALAGVLKDIEQATAALFSITGCIAPPSSAPASLRRGPGRSTRCATARRSSCASCASPASRKRCARRR